MCNQNHKGAARQFKFRRHGRWRARMLGRRAEGNHGDSLQRTGDNAVEFSLRLEPLESVLIVFSPKRPARPFRIEAGHRPIHEPIL